MNIDKKEIRSISDQHVRVVTKNIFKSMIIPAKMDGYLEIKEMLGKWKEDMSV